MVDAKIIRDFFHLLNKENLNYVLIKNDGGVIPEKIHNGDDVDILIHPCDYERFAKVMEQAGYSRLAGESKKYFFVYKMKPDIFLQKEDAFFHAYDKLSCVSFTNMGRSKLPLDNFIQEYIWKNKKWDSINNWWIMNDKVILLYLIIRSVLDKQEFRIKYIQEIEKRSHLLDDDEFLTMCRLVFFNFTDLLIKKIKSFEYNDIVYNYQRFKDY